MCGKPDENCDDYNLYICLFSNSHSIVIHRLSLFQTDLLRISRLFERTCYYKDSHFGCSWKLHAQWLQAFFVDCSSVFCWVLPEQHGPQSFQFSVCSLFLSILPLLYAKRISRNILKQVVYMYQFTPSTV